MHLGEKIYGSQIVFVVAAQLGCVIVIVLSLCAQPHKYLGD